jgi:hypothetical protein
LENISIGIFKIDTSNKVEGSYNVRHGKGRQENRKRMRGNRREDNALRKKHWNY